MYAVPGEWSTLLELAGGHGDDLWGAKQQVGPRLTAAVPVQKSYCMAYSCNPYGEKLLQL